MSTKYHGSGGHYGLKKSLEIKDYYGKLDRKHPGEGTAMVAGGHWPQSKDQSDDKQSGGEGNKAKKA